MTYSAARPIWAFAAVPVLEKINLESFSDRGGNACKYQIAVQNSRKSPKIAHNPFTC
jgi:hypothetical protein